MYHERFGLMIGRLLRLNSGPLVERDAVQKTDGVTLPRLHSLKAWPLINCNGVCFHGAGVGVGVGGSIPAVAQRRLISAANMLFLSVLVMSWKLTGGDGLRGFSAFILLLPWCGVV